MTTNQHQEILRTEGLSKFFPGVKAVLQAAKKGELTGISDAFASLIKVPQKFNTAIETCLGSALQDIVCDNEKAAKEAISFLKKTQAGRATFLPLDTLKPYQADIAPVKDMAGICGKASELIEYPVRIK